MKSKTAAALHLPIPIPLLEGNPFIMLIGLIF